jgi:hypothetical protein
MPFVCTPIPSRERGQMYIKPANMQSWVGLAPHARNPTSGNDACHNARLAPDTANPAP